MKRSMNGTMLMTVLCLLGGSLNASAGRIIEFQSGPEGFDTKTFFYEGEQEVVAFDAQFTPELATQAIQRLREFTQKPLKWLVITHPNPDKFNGASVFQREGARVLSSGATARAIPEVHAYKEHYFVEVAKMFAPGKYPQPIAVDETFEGQRELVLGGGERIELRELAQPGVSSTQTVAYLPEANALVVGDLVHYQTHAWLEGGIVNGKPMSTLDGWIADLAELSSRYPANVIVYGGRGSSVDLETAVASQVSYLRQARELVRQEIRELGDQAAGFNGAEAGALYKALAAKFQARFPGYSLAYLIEYGVYGLVQSELSPRQ